MKTVLNNRHILKHTQILTALILTGSLSVSSGVTLLKSATASQNNSLAETVNEFQKGNIKKGGLPQPVARAVLQNLSRQEGILPSKLKIIEYSQQTWRNGCLDLPKPDELCTQALVPGWRVIASNGSQRWIYHTNSSGSNLRLANSDTPTNNQSKNLPNSVRNAVFKAGSKRLNQPISRFKIVEAQRRTWRDGCLELADRNTNCIQVLVPGWRVVANADNQTLVYHTNESGSIIRLNQRESQISSNKLPQKVSDAILKAASQRTGLPISQLRITNVKQITTDGCLGLARPDEACIQIAQKAWEVTVQAPKQRLVYRASQDASQVRLNENASRVTLPKSITNAVLEDASEELGLPVSQLRIVEVERREWPDRCLGISEPLILCTPSIVPGWRVTVGDGEQRLVYRVGEPNTIKFDRRASKITRNDSLNPVSIPTSELPPPLESGMVFRQISSGGFAGRTYETVLLDDGSLIRVRIGDANDSERSVRRISLQQLRQFQRLLAENGSDSFQNLSYPAPTGAADYITYTLTSPDGTVQFNDISQNRLPKNLQVVLKAWNQLIQ
ncbi:hypothetical protein PCC6912_22980 [Chlorogloeopsis fritschii PCC 6912]|uniref:Uncharacterized protein n=1 Tax=Chlorogloeopsis fritschii PCC 6912 TaxID=211165 RepID=A0A433NKY8_CHLFR|nr:hypothetical protein [Chlorogloeopsis fritschii]RUR83465.1 hypothetical protein PCC6912_22980 [Chlorogloeopsis fritschii PCC 6912]